MAAARVKEQFEEEMRQQLVEEEGLLDESEWRQLMGATSSRAVGRQQGSNKEEIIRELGNLFPSYSPASIAAAAAAAADLEAAVFHLLSSVPPSVEDDEQVPLEIFEEASLAGSTSVSSSPPARAASRPLASAAAGSLKTPPVTTGACGFGLWFDVKTKDQPIVITGLRSASSPGLNWGQGQAVRMKVLTTSGTGRGKELNPSAWELVGEEEVSLPMVSWADTNPEYGSLPLQQPLRIPPNSVRSFLLHTNDLYGLVQSVGAGAGGTMEFWDEDEDGPQPYRCGSEITSNEHLEIRCGLSIGAMLFEEFEGVALPQPGGFAGVIEYTVG
ncbi:hypothetical protein GUITHDRAFT_155561 [Guillardia theta CCMP2712]|uniref:Uncharacterized protein n=1 Tax=Guillardia theta (strain CCMP2712) TaxID=905079 RepID=L1IG15_GUITC|nr:hypothetical protein GUITHDRAFT_155561 [Guillardia theta CCMP2712]EKX35206.1 hypothetical protein GUITHDRAFT_155561 [Guillardia theta CCMP2712]|eukprot:XP_005822186.1 hypothetical protein GUITHDRAFT_155561 [Guillardia theta CCMP2712]